MENFVFVMQWLCIILIEKMKLLAGLKKAKEKGINAIVFDRSGYKYTGRVAALAEAAREAGLSF